MGYCFAEAQRQKYRRYFQSRGCHPGEWARGAKGKDAVGSKSAGKGKDRQRYACGEWGHTQHECPHWWARGARGHTQARRVFMQPAVQPGDSKVPGTERNSRQEAAQPVELTGDAGAPVCEPKEPRVASTKQPAMSTGAEIASGEAGERRETPGERKTPASISEHSVQH